MKLALLGLSLFALTFYTACGTLSGYCNNCIDPECSDQCVQVKPQRLDRDPGSHRN